MKLKDSCSLGKKKSYDKPGQHIKKQRHHFSSKGPCSQSYVFSPVTMYGCECWTIKKDECQRIDSFKLWCWRRLLRVPWTSRRSNQSILKEINPEYSLERLMLKLKVQYFGHLMQRADSYPDAWKDWRQQEKGVTEIEFAQTLGNSEGQGSLACCSSWSCRKTGLRDGTAI